MIPAQKILDKASAPTLERIRRDRRRAPHQIQPLLDYLEANLFDPDLDANQLKRACGVRDNSLPIQFHHALALPPYAYIEDCRLEVACRLLSESPLKIWQIAQLLGYSTLQVFSRAFHRWSGLRPSIFRRRARKAVPRKASHCSPPGEAAATTPGQAPADETLISFEILRRAVQGGLGREEADELSSHLIRLYPESFPSVAEATAEALRPEPCVRLAAEEAWALLQSRSQPEQRSLVQNRLLVASVELFHFLVRKSIELGRHDYQLGIETAELALECLAAQSATLGELEYREFEVKGWIWLANAHRRALDFPAAEAALQQAQARLSPHTSTRTQAELLLVLGAYQMDQRHLEESLGLVDRAIDLCESCDHSELLVRCLILRIQIYYLQGRKIENLPEFWRALPLLARIDDSYLHFSFYQALVVIFTQEGAPRQAVQYLPAIRELRDQYEVLQGPPHVEWLEGLVARDLGDLPAAEEHFRSARQGFFDIDEPLHSMMVSLELTMLCAEQERHLETLKLATEMIPVFEAFKIQHREGLMALRLLRDAVESQELSVSTFRKIRSCLQQIQRSAS